MDEEIEMGKFGDGALGRCNGHVEGEGDTFVERYGRKCWAHSASRQYIQNTQNPMPAFLFLLILKLHA